MSEAMILHKKQATKSGGSIRVALPPDWVRGEGVEHGDELDMLESGMMVILPPRELKDDEINDAFECIKRMIKIAYRNRNVRR